MLQDRHMSYYETNQYPFFNPHSEVLNLQYLPETYLPPDLSYPYATSQDCQAVAFHNRVPQESPYGAGYAVRYDSARQSRRNVLPEHRPPRRPVEQNYDRHLAVEHTQEPATPRLNAGPATLRTVSRMVLPSTQADMLSSQVPHQMDYEHNLEGYDPYAHSSEYEEEEEALPEADENQPPIIPREERDRQSQFHGVNRKTKPMARRNGPRTFDSPETTLNGATHGGSRRSPAVVEARFGNEREADRSDRSHTAAQLEQSETYLDEGGWRGPLTREDQGIYYERSANEWRSKASVDIYSPNQNTYPSSTQTTDTIKSATITSVDQSHPTKTVATSTAVPKTIAKIGRDPKEQRKVKQPIKSDFPALKMVKDPDNGDSFRAKGISKVMEALATARKMPSDTLIDTYDQSIFSSMLPAAMSLGSSPIRIAKKEERTDQKLPSPLARQCARASATEPVAQEAKTPVKSKPAVQQVEEVVDKAGESSERKEEGLDRIIKLSIKSSDTLLEETPFSERNPPTRAPRSRPMKRKPASTDNMAKDDLDPMSKCPVMPKDKERNCSSSIDPLVEPVNVVSKPKKRKSKPSETLSKPDGKSKAKGKKVKETQAQVPLEVYDNFMTEEDVKEYEAAGWNVPRKDMVKNGPSWKFLYTGFLHKDRRPGSPPVPAEPLDPLPDLLPPNGLFSSPPSFEAGLSAAVDSIDSHEPILDGDLDSELMKLSDADVDELNRTVVSDECPSQYGLLGSKLLGTAVATDRVNTADDDRSASIEAENQSFMASFSSFSSNGRLIIASEAQFTRLLHSLALDPHQHTQHLKLHPTAIQSLSTITHITFQHFPSPAQVHAISVFASQVPGGYLFPCASNLYLTTSFQMSLLSEVYHRYDLGEWITYVRAFTSIANIKALCVDYTLRTMEIYQIRTVMKEFSQWWGNLSACYVHKAGDDLPLIMPGVKHIIMYDRHTPPFNEHATVTCRDTYLQEGVDEMEVISSASEEEEMDDILVEVNFFDWWFKGIARGIVQNLVKYGDESSTNWVLRIPLQEPGEKRVKYLTSRAKLVGLVQDEMVDALKRGERIEGVDWRNQTKIETWLGERLALAAYGRMERISCVECGWSLDL